MDFRSRRTSVHGVGAIATLALATFACTASTSASEEATSSSSVASLVVVERTVMDDGTAKMTGVARYFRGTLDDRTVRTLGAELDLPSLGTCQEVGEDSSAIGRGIELEEAGTVTLEGAERSVVLSPRWVPDPIGRVRGTIYSGAWAEGDFSGASVLLRSTQFGEGATFVAPRDPSGIAVAGTQIAGGWVSAPSGNVELSWLASERDRDLVYVDISGGGARTRCSFADAGRARIALPLGTGTVSVHRLFREQRRGFADVRFDTQVTFNFVAR